MNTLPGLLALRPFPAWPASEQAVLRLDAAPLAFWAQRDPARASALLAHASAARRLEFLAGRALAAQLLADLGQADVELRLGAGRAPRWPAGVAGSLSHTPRLVSAAVRRSSAAKCIGIDAEPVLDAAAAQGVHARCLAEAERVQCRSCDEEEALRLTTAAFSAKESFFKCVSAAAGGPFDACDAVVDVSAVASGVVRVRMANSVGALRRGFALDGTCIFALGHAFTAFAWAP